MKQDIFKPRIEKYNGEWFVCDGRRLVRGRTLDSTEEVIGNIYENPELLK